MLNSKLRFICATTEDECKLIKNDKALNRRFNSINLEEFSKKQMFMVAKKLSEPYEKYHKVIFKTDDMDHIINVLDRKIFNENISR